MLQGELAGTHRGGAAGPPPPFQPYRAAGTAGYVWLCKQEQGCLWSCSLGSSALHAPISRAMSGLVAGFRQDTELRSRKITVQKITPIFVAAN